ncbi:Tetraspanin-33 [Anabarilius grahami]|uniref:Tetraspanin-33 n=1 Tax=Anabarilius grahami TaxID=495550 RepID=A0A3N0XDG0_ANAGA|nr:Tetraspanin-33 [Anabarilius grahami]
MARRTDELRRQFNVSNRPKKTDEGQLQPTVRNTLRKLSRPTNKNCPTADCRLETALACLTVDPALLLMILGILMFFITFSGCVGSLRENICLLQTFCIVLTIIFLLQLVAGVLGFVFSDKARGKVTDMVDSAIKHYRDDLDLQNLIDYGQKQAVINTMCGHGMQDLEYLKASAFINTNGCIDKVVNWIHSNLFLLGGIALGLAIPQLVGILLSQILINQIQDQIKLQNYNQQHRSDPWS